MMINGLLGKKIEMGQLFGEKGKVIPITILRIGPCVVTEVENENNVVQIGFEEKRGKPRHVKEVKTEGAMVKKGEVVSVADVFNNGDKVVVTGISKGKGFAGVVKRWGFAGGPKTHGQSDRQRAPGSIGTQNVGRVWKGKKMAGRMGSQKVTVKGLKVVEIDSENNLVKIKGAVPGARNSVVFVRKE